MDFPVSPRLRGTSSRQGRLESHARMEQHTAERQLPQWQAVLSLAKKMAVHIRHGDSASQRLKTLTRRPRHGNLQEKLNEFNGQSGRRQWERTSAQRQLLFGSDAGLPAHECQPPVRKTS